MTLVRFAWFTWRSDELPTGTVTFLFTDIEGSTCQWQEQPEVMKAVLARHDELLRRAIEDHGGYVVKTTGLCELAAVRGTEGVLEAVADVFDVTARSGQTLEQALVEFLRHKELLLVLDNCEHVLDEAAELVEALERSCPRVVVLATSREGMGIDGERILAVPSLGGRAPTRRSQRSRVRTR